MREVCEVPLYYDDETGTFHIRIPVMKNAVSEFRMAFQTVNPKADFKFVDGKVVPKSEATK